MQRAVLVALLTITLAGCAEDAEGPPMTIEDTVFLPIKATEIVNRTIRTYIGTDFIGRDYVGPLCDEELPEPIGGFDSKFELPRISGHKITENHTMLKFNFEIDDVFADNELGGRRFGAYYNHTLIFWSESFKEDATFTFKLNGMYDLDKDARWTFFGKHTDPTTEDNEDSCSSGFMSGSESLVVIAV